MTTFALLSDLHFGKFSQTSEFATSGEKIDEETNGGVSLKDGIIELLQKEMVTHLLITGDLSSTGSPHEFICCQNQIHAIADSSQINRKNIFWCLGNHDIDWRITRLAENYRDGYSADFPFSAIGNLYTKIAAYAPQQSMIEVNMPTCNGIAPFSGVTEIEDTIIFTLNSGWCSSHNQEYKHGKLTLDQLNWFRQNAIKYKGNPKFKIVLLHHHPFNYQYPYPGIDISTLEEGPEFINICGLNGINLVCHGHRHHPRVKTMKENGWQYPITFLCAGSTSVNSIYRLAGQIPNVFHIISVSPHDKDILLKNFQFSIADGWIPVRKNCAETPIDSEMYLGHIFDEQEKLISIHELSNSNEEYHLMPKWHNLPQTLRFISHGELNKLLREHLIETHNVVGNYPDDVILVRKN